MSKSKVLIIDDDPVVLTLHKLLLKKQNRIDEKDIMCFTSGKETLQYFNNKTEEDTFYLLLLDINMPFFDGWNLIEMLKYDNLKIIIVTSSIEQKDKLKAYSYKRVIDFYSKPLTHGCCKVILDHIA
ncbi:response regulator [Mesonia maritima]|uniref:CheY-like chemotaxis protein n=1 Tax=Mesonia maritima TaxID=1793873 RepID=A0ABU1K9G9_9FLAO|nr:response regulator [Mesonia maritima]MDR6301915.1 CheY-like chemotaxis protein [Mesonia maritima]